MALDNSSLEDRLAAQFKCGQPLVVEDALELIGELLASWQTNGIPVNEDIIGTTPQTPTFDAVVASGSVAAGAKSVSFTSSADFAGSILGTPFPPNSSIGFSAQNGKSLSALVYTRSAGTLYIAKVV